MKYVKYKKQYRFIELQNDKEFRERYANTLVHSRAFPHMFYCWFAYERCVVLFKRPVIIRSGNAVVSSVVLKTDTKKAAKVIARNLTDRELKRIFNKCNSVIL